MKHLVRNLFLIPVYFYRGVISGFIGPCCRYTPSCSSYFVEAVLRFGIIKGSIMGCARILRCRKAFLGGPDPVPEEWNWKEIKDAYTIYRKPKP